MSQESPAPSHPEITGNRFLGILVETPVPPLELDREIQIASRATFGFFVMLGLSAAIATLGLISNSTGVIIGAMIIAPLMNPIIAMAFAIGSRNLNLLKRGAGTLAIGILWVLAIAAATTWLVGFRIGGSEVLARANPNILDLGIAVGSGIAGAFAYTRKRIANALPGVAISVALVPPLCVVGIGLMVGPVPIFYQAGVSTDPIAIIEGGAGLLFLTNLAAILLFGSLTFITQGYGNWKRARNGLLFSLVLVVAISIPLGFSFHKLIVRNKIHRTLSELKVNNPHWEDARLSDIRVEFSPAVVSIEFDVQAPAGLITDADVATIQRAIEKSATREVAVSLNLLETRELKSGDEAARASPIESE